MRVRPALPNPSTLLQALLHRLPPPRNPTAPPISPRQDPMVPPMSLPWDPVAPPVSPHRDPTVPTMSLRRDSNLPSVSLPRDPMALPVSPARDPAAPPVPPPRDPAAPLISSLRELAVPPVSRLRGPASPPVLPVFVLVMLAPAQAPAPVRRAAEPLFFRLIHLHPASRPRLSSPVPLLPVLSDPSIYCTACRLASTCKRASQGPHWPVVTIPIT